MKLSLNWLREYVDLPPTPDALAELLTMSGLEVEAIHTRGADFPNVVVAQIRESVQHPNADRLSVCQVDDGSGPLRQIVCGAKNYKVGDKVPLALPGAILPGDFKIKAGKLRGVESNGMLCSAKELQLADDAEGLLILSPDARLGAPIAELFPADTVFDLEVTPNRPDLLSHLGIAREVSALTGSPLRGKKWRQAELNYSHGVQITAEECPFYTARLITGIQVGPSPEWLRQRLEAVGLRAINNVVDITNYVMLDRGQPLHAFDADKIQGDLNVRLATDGEKFPALNNATYDLKPHHLVIADAQRAVALAGVMGGAETGVTESTTRIWLESAYFASTSIRRTSRELGLISDSSYRFEREVDPAGLVVASQEATQLLTDLAGGLPGELRLGFAANAQFGFDAEAAVEGIEYTATVPFRPERCFDLLGIEFPVEEIEQILTRFGLRKTDAGWQIPSFRPDLTREIDLIEEVARTIGIAALPDDDIARFAPSSHVDHYYDRTMAVRRQLAALGLHETRTLSLISEETLKLHKTPEQCVRLKNPLGESAVLRPSLLPGLFEALARNARQGAESVRLFEIGRTFTGPSADSTRETEKVALVVSGPLRPASWRGRASDPADLVDLMGILSAIFGDRIRLHAYPRRDDGPYALFGELVVNEGAVGTIGQLWPADARKLDAAAPVVFAEFDLEGALVFAAAPAEKPAALDAGELLRPSNTRARYREIPRFPAVTRDIALLAAHTVTHEQVSRTLHGAKEPLLTGVQLFDLFSDPSGAKIASDKKSLAYSLTYRSPERTLTADEVNAAHARLKERLVRDLGVQLRE